MVRLDRFVADQTWIDNHPNFKVENLDFYSSDHRPIRLTTNPHNQTVSKGHSKRFTFEHYWTMEDDFETVVKDTWDNLSPDSSLGMKLDGMAKALTDWAKIKVGSIPKEIKRTKDKLDKILNDERKPYDASIMAHLENRLEKLLDQEETHWRQRSRNQWLTEGDRNTAFFHRTASDRKKKNMINNLEDKFGKMESDPAKIHGIVTEFYSDLFKTQNPSDRDIELTTELIPRVVTEDMNRKLCSTFSEEEVRKAVFDLSPNKAPGPDGFTALFFQKE